MLTDYSDIRSRLGTPVWFDESGVPRYCEFHPREVANIYADEVALCSITCQVCKKEFLVAQSGKSPSIQQKIEERMLDYGDPPNVSCSYASMSSVPRRVLQYWIRQLAPVFISWERRPAFEVDITPTWMVSADSADNRAAESPANSECMPPFAPLARLST